MQESLINLTNENQNMLSPGSFRTRRFRVKDQNGNKTNYIETTAEDLFSIKKIKEAASLHLPFIDQQAFHNYSMQKSMIRHPPVIARNNKLREFLNLSDRQNKSETIVESKLRKFKREKMIQKEQRKSLTFRELSMIKQNSAEFDRREEFQKLYIKQREYYNSILEQHGVNQFPNEDQFNIFIKA